MRAKKILQSFGLIFLVILFSVVIKACSTPVAQTGSAIAQVSPGTGGDLYDRVVQSGTIRAGYISYPPGSFKDPNTGELSGIFVDALEKAGEDLGLKVEWTEEVAWGTMIEGLLADRYDLIGTAIWETPPRGKVADFSIPLFYSGMGVFVRQDDNRFDKNLSAINSKDVNIATIDGEIAEVVAKSNFPEAKRVSLGQISDVSQMMLNVVQKKADVSFIEAYTGYEFLQKNPGTLKNVVADNPVSVFGNSMVFKDNQPRFESMLNTALKAQLNSGYIDQLMKKYIPEEGLMYQTAYPYRSPS